MTPIRIRLKEFRDAKRMSQADLAKRANVRIATISAIENGKTSRVDLDVVERLAAALDVDPGLLFVKVKSSQLKRSR